MNYLTYELPLSLGCGYPYAFTSYTMPINYIIPLNYFPNYNLMEITTQINIVREVKEKNDAMENKLKKDIIEQDHRDEENKKQRNKKQLYRTFSKDHKNINLQESQFDSNESQSDEQYQQDSFENSKFVRSNKFHNNRKKIYKQNPCRNILTNIGNQLITFICSLKKSKNILLNLMPKNQFQIKQFYEYASKLKKQTDYYLNINKIKCFWLQQKSQDDKKFKKYIRALSNYYLRWIIPLSILTSKKMSAVSRDLHLKARKQLLNALKK